MFKDLKKLFYVATFVVMPLKLSLYILTWKIEKLLLYRLTQMIKYIEFKSNAPNLVKLFLAYGTVE